MMDKLLFLIAGGAAEWRIRLAARAVLGKVILQVPTGPFSVYLCELRETI